MALKASATLGWRWQVLHARGDPRLRTGRHLPQPELRRLGPTARRSRSTRRAAADAPVTPSRLGRDGQQDEQRLVPGWYSMLWTAPSSATTGTHPSRSASREHQPPNAAMQRPGEQPGGQRPDDGGPAERDCSGWSRSALHPPVADAPQDGLESARTEPGSSSNFSLKPATTVTVDDRNRPPPHRDQLLAGERRRPAAASRQATGLELAQADESPVVAERTARGRLDLDRAKVIACTLRRDIARRERLGQVVVGADLEAGEGDRRQLHRAR